MATNNAINYPGPLTNGQIVIGSTGSAPLAGTLTAGNGINITNGAASITVSVIDGGANWTDVSGTTQAMAVDNGYIADNAGLVTLTLPATAVIGSTIKVMGKGAGGWLIAQNSGQTIHLGFLTTTTGTGGSLASTNAFDSITLVCITANTTWSTLNGPEGNITVV